MLMVKQHDALEEWLKEGGRPFFLGFLTNRGQNPSSDCTKVCPRGWLPWPGQLAGRPGEPRGTDCFLQTKPLGAKDVPQSPSSLPAGHTQLSGQTWRSLLSFNKINTKPSCVDCKWQVQSAPAEPPLVKAEPISHGGGTSKKTCLREGRKHHTGRVRGNKVRETVV